MSADMSLVVLFGPLEDMQSAIQRAHDVILIQVATTLDRVDGYLAGWAPDTLSRAAEMAHRDEVRRGVQRLADALGQIGHAIEDVSRLAREAEVRNVAVIG